LKSVQRLMLATVSLLTFAAPALSSSVVMIDSTPKAGHSSIIYLGRPLDCSVDDCPKAEPVVETAAPASGAMVDAFGMPTKMPTILRGGQSSDDTVIMAPTAAQPAPAAVSAPAAAAPVPAPVSSAASGPSVNSPGIR
jgi:hypothetical protein